MKQNVNSKDVMLIHSEAKVNFYKAYLERYLQVLCHSTHIDEIHIFDVFCGRGIYENGGKGSPIQAHDTIKEIIKRMPDKNKITMYMNDKNVENVINVINYIHKDCNANDIDYNKEFSVLDGEEYLQLLANNLKNPSPRRRNLIFIDPYGYKQIKKTTIENLLSNGRTEVMIFLPISFMTRFKNCALLDCEYPQYRPLYQFVKSFFVGNHPVIVDKQISDLEFVSHLTEAFRFGGKYYSTSYHIERSNNCYFALFFITNHIYGYEKILETKWKLDEKDGNGFELPKEPSLFDEIEKEDNKKFIFERLYRSTLYYLKNNSRTNVELYEFVLQNEYLPTHLNKVLQKMDSEGRLIIKNLRLNLPYKKGAYYIGYKNDVRISIQLKE